MIGLLILAQRDMGEGLIAAADHVLGERPAQLEALPIDYHETPEQLAEMIQHRLARLDRGDGVLILADLYGASHTNAACRLLQKGRVELIAGVNLPMLIRVLNYRHLGLPELVAKILQGPGQGVVGAPCERRTAERGR